MGNIGDSISESAPAVGTAGTGYASTINALLTEVKARLVAKIPLSSLLTNSDLDLNGQALLNAGYITMVNEAVSPVASPLNRVAAFGGDFWWVSPAGAVKITDGNQLNAAGIGGITGDYSGAGPMEFRYDTANTRYDAFANQSTNTWAYVRARGFDIAASATSTFRLRHAYAVAANGTLTWGFNSGSGTGATASIMTVDSSGNIEAAESIRAEEKVFYQAYYKNISAIDLFTRGLFASGGGAAGVSVTDNVYRYNMSHGSDSVTIQIDLDSEGATEQTVPKQISGVTWFGSTPGGFPSVELWKVQHDGVGNPALTTALLEEAQTSLTLVSTTGDVDRGVYACNTPLTWKGDEVIYLRITAGTANIDTYHVAVEYSKIS